LRYISAPAFAQKLWRAGQHNRLVQYVGHKFFFVAAEVTRLISNQTNQSLLTSAATGFRGVCSLLIWSAPAERSSDGAFRWTHVIPKAVSRYACHRSPKVIAAAGNAPALSVSETDVLASTPSG
jgi:hypothetical protein